MPERRHDNTCSTSLSRSSCSFLPPTETGFKVQINGRLPASRVSTQSRFHARRWWPEGIRVTLYHQFPSALMVTSFLSGNISSAAKERGGGCHRVLKQHRSCRKTAFNQLLCPTRGKLSHHNQIRCSHSLTQLSVFLILIQISLALMIEDNICGLMVFVGSGTLVFSQSNIKTNMLQNQEIWFFRFLLCNI